MKTKLSITYTSLIVMILSACGMAGIPGSGKVVKESRNVKDYSQVVFSAPGELTIVQNGNHGLEIEVDDNFLQYIKTTVNGDALYIYVEPEFITLYPTKSIRYTLDVDTLTQVTLNGSGGIRAGALVASNLDFDLNGSGDILIASVKSQTTTIDLDGSGNYRCNNLMTGQLTSSLDGSGDIFIKEILVKDADLDIAGSGNLTMKDVFADTLTMKISGSGDSILVGEVNGQEVVIHGSGSYNAQGLQSQESTVEITGSGDSQVWAAEKLGITITGSGDVAYRGTPTITKTVTGSGDIIMAERQ